MQAATSGEISVFADAIVAKIERIIRCLDGQDADGLNWRLPAPATNSLYVLASHMMGSVEWCILDVLGRQPVARDRAAEFSAHGDSAEPLYARWSELAPRLHAALAALPATALETTREIPPLGAMTGQAFLLFIAQHCAEHMGHAELTRDLLNATRG